jgi:hypothetical protein
MMLTGPGGDVLQHAMPNDTPVSVVIEGEVMKPNPNLQFGYGLFTDDMDALYWSTQLDMPEESWVELQRGSFRLTSRIPARFLNEGRYHVGLFFSLHRRQRFSEPGAKGTPLLTFDISGGLSDSPCHVVRRPGFLSPIIPWEVRTGVELLA